jgi:hypothetical protein
MEWFLGGLGVLIVVALAAWWLSRKKKRKLDTSSKSVVGPGFSVWSYEGGSWRRLEDRSSPGFIPGPPPTEPGRHEGYCVKVPSIRDPRAR